MVLSTLQITTVSLAHLGTFEKLSKASVFRYQVFTEPQGQGPVGIQTWIIFALSREDLVEQVTMKNE